MIVKALAGLHSAGIVHGALGPVAVLWYSRSNAMKLSDLSCATAVGEAMPVSGALRYSPPEVRSPIGFRVRKVQGE